MDKTDFIKCVNEEVLRFMPHKKIPKLIKLMYLTHYEPSCRAIYFIRKMQYSASQSDFFHRLLAQKYHMKLVREFGMCIAMNAKIDIGLHIPHPTSIVIGNCSVIGKNCSIYQNCTIGGSRVGDVKKGNQPVIGDNVTIFAGSMVLGHIRVSDNVTVGANSVLLNDAESDGVYIGSPAKRYK